MNVRGRNSKAARTDQEVGEAAVDWAVSAGAAGRAKRDLAIKDRRAKWRRACAAGRALAAAVCVALVRPARHPDRSIGQAKPESVPTIVSSPATQVLADGTIVETNRGAEVLVEFSEHERRVKLARSEAHFTVFHNPARPFIVSAAGVEARAIGTAFAMKVSDSGGEVFVTEGRVAVEKDAAVVGADVPAASAKPLATLEAGTRVVVELSAASAVSSVVIPVPPPEIEARHSWRIPRLDFSATPLAEVLPMFNRHGRVRITLEDPPLGELLITGVLRADNPDSLVELLEIAFQVKAERRGDGEIVLRR